MLASAIHSYEKGATGQGITAAVIDDGIGQNSPQFAGRIHGASTDVVGSRGIHGGDGHGTYVASVLGAAKDGVGMHGVAFDATLLILRVDMPGNQADGIAKAIDLAVQNNARVINISLGGNYTEFPVVVQAIDRATAAGLVLINTAGNEGAAQPIQSSFIALDPAARGSIIIAGSTNQAGSDLASFSNRAGSAANVYLVAAGEKMQVFDKDGNLTIKSGTSLSAPVIAGAVALLAQAFPHMTGKQIVDLLLATATDMGAAGVDNIYGRGMLNLKNAFSPQGPMTLAGSNAPVSLVSNGVLSPAMGDANGDLKGAVFLDGYARAYEADLGRTLSRSAQAAPLHAALDGSYRTDSVAAGPLAVSITTSHVLGSRPETRLHQMELSPDQVRRARAIAATAVGRLSSKTAVAFGFSQSGKELQQRLSEQHGNAFLVARDPVAVNGFHARLGTSLGMRHNFGPVAFTMTSEDGEVHHPNPAVVTGRSGYRITALTADRHLGRMRVSFGGSRLDEEATILGGHFSSAFLSAGSTSWFADGAASLDFGGGWGAYASYRHGWTSVRGGNALVQGGRLTSNAFAFDLTKTSVLQRSDKIGLRIMQPLRVRSGGFDVNLPVSYDYASGKAAYQSRFLDLAPTGREIDYELSYTTRMLGGSMAATVFVRTDPGHIERMNTDRGGAVRFTLGF